MRQLERDGGAVWAFKQGAGSLFELRHVGVRGGATAIIGRLYPEAVIFEDRPVPLDELKLLGWKYGKSGWERDWAIRSDVDRTELRRVALATVAVLAALQDEEASSYALAYRPPGEEDAGYAQVGCLFAATSTFIAEVIGIALTVARNEPVPVVGMTAFTGAIGLVGGFLCGTLVPKLLALSSALRKRAGGATAGSMLVVPGVTVLAIWLAAPALEPLDEDILLAIPGALIVAFLVWSFIPLIRLIWRGDLGPR